MFGNFLASRSTWPMAMNTSRSSLLGCKLNIKLLNVTSTNKILWSTPTKAAMSNSVAISASFIKKMVFRLCFRSRKTADGYTGGTWVHSADFLDLNYSTLFS